MTGHELVCFLSQLIRQREWIHDGVTRLPGGWRFRLTIRNTVTGEVVEMECYQTLAVILAYVQAERYGSFNVRYHNQTGEANR